MAKMNFTKKDADELMKVQGHVHGSIYKADCQLVLEKGGEEKVKEVEDKLMKWGYPVKFKEISTFRWYSEAHACLVYIAMLEVLDWDDSRAHDIGYEVPIHSTLTKLLMKYLSPETLFKQSGEHWRRHFDFGKMKCTEYNKEKKQAILQLDNFKKFHPTLYDYIRGYICRLAEMVLKTKEIKVEQTKSLYNNDSYDEFKVTWE